MQNATDQDLTSAIGTSLRFHKNCAAFLQRLSAVHHLSHTAVAIRADDWSLTLADPTTVPTADRPTRYVIAHAQPRIDTAMTAALVENSLVERILRRRGLCLPASELGLAHLATANHADPQIHFSALGQFGYVVGVEAGASPHLLYPPAPLFSVFARSVRNALEHETQMLIAARQAALDSECSLAQRLDALTTTADDILHELNNLMTPLLNYPGLIRERHGGGEPIEHELVALEAAANRASELNSQLAEVIAGIEREQPVAVRLDDCVRILCSSAWSDELRKRYPTTRLTFACDQPVTAVTDPGLLFRMLIRFITDAVTAISTTGMTAGTAHIAVYRDTLAAKTLSSGPLPAGDYAIVELTDDRAHSTSSHDRVLEALAELDIGGYADVSYATGRMQRTLLFPIRSASNESEQDNE